MVKRKGRRPPSRRQRRPGARLQSNLQRLKSGTVRSGRLPADPRARNMYGTKAGIVEIHLRVASAASSSDYGNTTTPAIVDVAPSAPGFTITNVFLKNCIAQQIIGLGKDDLVSGSMQYSINNFQAWAGEERTTLYLNYLVDHALFPMTSMTDVSGKMGRARIKMALPCAVWQMDNVASSSIAYVQVNVTPTPTTGERVAIIRVSVQYHTIAALSTAKA